MPTTRNKRRTQNKPRKKNKQKLCDEVSIVGPDCIQVLRGKLFDKQVSLILCGESHYDALDVTRSGGRFYPKYGWMEITTGASSIITTQASLCRLIQESKKVLPLNKAKEWGKHIVEKDEEEWEHGAQILLLWIPSGTDAKTIKGKGYLLEFMNEEDDTSSEEEEERGTTKNKSLPSPIAQWLDSVNSGGKDDTVVVFEWADLDVQAHELNRRRLTEEDIHPAELDALVELRKLDRRKQGIWTFDDWLDHVRNETPKTHLILEGSVPPWEVELHRPCETQTMVPAHDIIRCVSEDSDESTADMHDPSMDGVGSYMDFVYRKFMTQMLQEQTDSDPASVSSTWLHCVDTRDLGCEAACHAEEVKKRWNDLLLPQERRNLLGSSDQQDGNVDRKSCTFVATTQPANTPGESQVSAGNEAPQLFQPASILNAELVELESMRARGVLQKDGDDDDGNGPEWEDGSNFDFSFPSFEGFFGQCTDCMYYTPHLKLVYSPFLAKCVGSLCKWEDFCTKLFFGGTIPDALSVLDIQPDCVYVRSRILKEWDPVSSEYSWRERDEADHFISYPYFPHMFYLKAKNSGPARTWSSQLYANLMEFETSSHKEDGCMSRAALAHAARDWALSSIARHSNDPKGSDDVECGGEWFAAFLRAAHRDIYDDIDLTDQAVLLQKNYIASESGGRRAKHNVGKIKIPSTAEGFEEMIKQFQALNKLLLPHDEKVITDRVEALAKILIDIWVSNLVDFSTVLKIADIVSRDDSTDNRVVAVCYMGTAHVRAIADFYCSKAGFRKTNFVGKYVWEEDEVKTLKLPSKLWNLSELFQ